MQHRHVQRISDQTNEPKHSAIKQMLVNESANALISVVGTTLIRVARSDCNHTDRVGARAI